MTKSLLVWLTILAFAAAAPAPAETPRTGGTLVFGSDSVGRDRAHETDGTSLMIGDNVFETLVAYADESADLEPGLAKSWDISPDGKTYIFHLRKGITFHDGAPFNADAVAFSIGRMMKAPDVTFLDKGLTLPPRERPPEYRVPMGMDDTVGAIEVVGEHTVVFKLKRMEAPFLANLGMAFANIVSPSAFLKNPGGFPRNPVGTGPFRFVSRDGEDRVVLEKNPDYWDKTGGPYLDRLVFRAIPENPLRFLELKTGDIHICQSPDPADVARAGQDPDLKLARQPGMNVGYLSFNHTKEPWKSNLHLRRAVAHALDREAIVDNVYQGMGQVAKNPIPPTMWGYNTSVPGYAFDVELARAELVKAGFPGGEGLPEITLWCMPVSRPYNPGGLKAGFAIAADLARVGIQARIVSYEWGAYLQRQRAQPGDMDLFQLGWTGGNGDPDNFLAVLFDGLASPLVRTQWKNAEYHRLMLDGRQTADQAKRAEIYRKAQQVIFDEVGTIPIAHATVIWPMVNRVMNFKLHPTGSVRMKNVWLK